MFKGITMRNLILLLCLLLSLSSVASAHILDEEERQTNAIKVAILRGDYRGFEDLIEVLSSLKTDESRVALVDLLRYDLGELPLDVLELTIVRQGITMLPYLKSALKDKPICQKSLMLLNGEKALRCRDEKEFLEHVTDLINTIENKK